jgi:7-cyano-7-deazaguanine reductase
MEELSMKKWDFKKKIEDMSPQEVRERIEKAYAQKMPEIVGIPYVGVDDEVITYIYPELTALCPMTGLQDLYTLEITLEPNKFVPELKSLKFYLMGYRELPISHEHLASKIYEDLERVLAPGLLEINLDTAVRGGIKTIVEI